MPKGSTKDGVSLLCTLDGLASPPLRLGTGIAPWNDEEGGNTGEEIFEFEPRR